jgi:hypothetical protein
MLKISSVDATTNHNASEQSGNQETSNKRSVGFEVLTAVVIKSTTIFWDIVPCSLLKVMLCGTLVTTA